jgi:hypothetical protein
MKVTMVLLAMVVGATAQDRSATSPFKDVSQPVQKIVSFSGQATLTVHQTGTDATYGVKGSLSFANISSKNILTMTVDGLCGGLKIEFEHENYFRPSVISPGESQVIWEEVDPVTSGPRPVVPMSPDCTVALRAVQFDDGTTWGDQRELDRLFAQRRDVTEFLLTLQNVYSTGGETAVVNDITKFNSSRSMLAKMMANKFLSMYTGGAGIQEVMSAVNERLNIGGAHKF